MDWAIGNCHLVDNNCKIVYLLLLNVSIEINTVLYVCYDLIIWDWWIKLLSTEGELLSTRWLLLSTLYIAINKTMFTINQMGQYA